MVQASPLLAGSTRIACLCAAEAFALDVGNRHFAEQIRSEIALILQMVSDMKRLDSEKQAASQREDFEAALLAKREAELIRSKLAEQDARGNVESEADLQVGSNTLLAVQRTVEIAARRAEAAGNYVERKIEEVTSAVVAADRRVADAGQAIETFIEEAKPAERIANSIQNLGELTASSLASLAPPLKPTACPDCGGSGRRGMFGPKGLGLLTKSCLGCQGSGVQMLPEARGEWPEAEDTSQVGSEDGSFTVMSG